MSRPNVTHPNVSHSDEQTPASESQASSEKAVISTRHRHLVIRASAGSGKTYQLALRYLRHLLDGVPVERILASTFTRKAAGEILGRVLVQLAVATHDEKQRNQLAEHLGAKNLDHNVCCELLKSLTRELHRLRVGTLDSFFSRLATSYTLELGLPPGWEIVDELTDNQLRTMAIETVLKQGQTNETVQLMNLLAKGDASRRVSGLIQSTVDDCYEVFCETDAAAWRRFPDLPPLSAEQLAATLEELKFVELTDLPSHHKRRDKDWQLADAGDWETFLTEGFGKAVAQGKRRHGNSKKEISDEAVDVYERLIQHGMAVLIKHLAAQTAATHDLLSQFDVVYRRLKQESRSLRFEDVTEHLADAFAARETREAAMQGLAYRLDSDIAHLMLDEFQDTSLSQWQVIHPFAERITTAKSDTSFFCVGDAKQAIYGWRGGVAEIFDAVSGQLGGVTTTQLNTSFRSSPVVIETVNELFANLPRHPNLGRDEETIREWCSCVETHEAEKPDLAGYVTVETGREFDKDVKDDRKASVIEQTAQRVAVVHQQSRDARIGVLVRAKDQIPALIHELRERGIDASEEAGNPLIDSAAVLAMLALLQMADHPGDTIARFHVATSPLGPAMGFTEHDDDELAGRLAADLRRCLIDDGYGASIDAWARHLFPACRDRESIRLRQLVEMAYQFGEQSTLRPSDFVRFVEAEKVQAPSSDRVQVMTVHASKGLEFDVVVLPLTSDRLITGTPKIVTLSKSATEPPFIVSRYCSQGIQSLLPDDLRAAFESSQADRVREELCVLYVAVTRAIHALHIVVPPSSATENKFPKNAAGLVRAGLVGDGRVEPLSVLYEQGDADWSATLAVDEGDAPKTSEAAPLTVRLAEMIDGRQRGLGRLAPSQAGPVNHVRLSHLVQSRASTGMQRGSLLHGWFEQIGWLDDGLPTDDALRLLARRMGFSAGETERHLVAFRAMLERSAVAEILSRSSYESLVNLPVAKSVRDELAAGAFELSVEAERRVATRIEGDLLTGSIDRLVLLRQDGRVVAADILDYKTDSIGPSGASNLDRTEHYRRQLEAYAAAIGLIYRLSAERISARLVFVESGEVVSV